MPASVSELINQVEDIHKACTEAGNSKQVLQVAGEQLWTTKPLLELLGKRPNMEHLITQMNTHLQEFSKIVDQAKDMKTILYLVKANSIHQGLDRALGNIQFTLAAAVSGQQQNDDQIQTKKDLLVKQWDRIGGEMVALKDREEQERRSLVEGDVTANLLRFTGNSSQEMQAIMDEMKAEKKELRRKAQTSNDKTVITKLRQDDAYITKVIGALELVEEQSQRQHHDSSKNNHSHKGGLAEWVYCPITAQIMTDPVTVDATCQHAFGRNAIQEWLDKGNNTCPACQRRLRSSNISPSPQLKQAIEERISYDLPGAPQEMGLVKPAKAKCCIML